MTFPAADRLNDSTVNDLRPSENNQNVRENIRNDSKSDSPPNPNGNRANLEIPPIVSGDGNEPSWIPLEAEFNGIRQIDVPVKPVIQATVVGPKSITTDVPDLFEIEVSNSSNRNATNIVVQMGVSEDLTITDFDRQAWLDKENRTVSWKLTELPGGYKDVIRFRAVSSTPGKHEQSITIGMENTFQGQTAFVANVIQKPGDETNQSPVFDE